jgi:hypothetical protein
MFKNLTRNKILVVVFLIVLNSVFFSYSFAQDEWNQKKSKHFIIYYQDVPNRYIADLAAEAENYYNEITEYLGYKGFDFWTWENRCRIYIYKNRQEYLQATGSAKWSRAHVNVKDKKIDSYYAQDIFYETILPHELGHIIFRAFIGLDKKLPLCLDEGIACNQEANYSVRLKIAAVLAKRNMYTPFNQILSIDKKDFVNPAYFYSQCASMVDFLITKFGRRRFTALCRKIRDENNWKNSLLNIYQFENLKDFEKRWLEYLTID